MAPRPLTTKQFVEKSVAVHGALYDYSKVEYVSAHRKVTIGCPTHGDFEQAAYSHLKGYGCKFCGPQKASKSRPRMSTEEFIQKAKKVHGDKYTYADAVCVNAKTRVAITCPEHGSFYKRPGRHLKGSGCPTCSWERAGKEQTLTTEQFVEAARKVHGSKYDYSEVDYTLYKSSVTISCPRHGPWLQLPSNHLQGHGCPSCSHAGPSKPEKRWLDRLGIHRRQHRIKLKSRTAVVDGFDPETNTVYEFLGDYWHGNPDVYDPHKINPSCGRTFGELYRRTMNRLEELRSAGYQVVAAWES